MGLLALGVFFSFVSLSLSLSVSFSSFLVHVHTFNVLHEHCNDDSFMTKSTVK